MKNFSVAFLFLASASVLLTPSAAIAQPTLTSSQALRGYVNTPLGTACVKGDDIKSKDYTYSVTNPSGSGLLYVHYEVEMFYFNCDSEIQVVSSISGSYPVSEGGSVTSDVLAAVGTTVPDPEVGSYFSELKITISRSSDGSSPLTTKTDSVIHTAPNNACSGPPE